MARKPKIALVWKLPTFKFTEVNEKLAAILNDTLHSISYCMPTGLVEQTYRN